MSKNLNTIIIFIILISLVTIFAPNAFIGKITQQECLSIGCYIIDRCLPFGTRFLHDGVMEYCEVGNEVKQTKAEDESCLLDYECENNICVEDKCKSYSTLKESYCRFREDLHYETYDVCMLCANNILDDTQDEECDPTAAQQIPGSIECSDYSDDYAAGQLSCTNDCKIDTTGCL